jgi:hypothetical protein
LDDLLALPHGMAKALALTAARINVTSNAMMVFMVEPRKQAEALPKGGAYEPLQAMSQRRPGVIRILPRSCLMLLRSADH